MKTAILKNLFFPLITCFLILTNFNKEIFSQPAFPAADIRLQKCWENGFENNGSDNTKNTKDFFINSKTNISEIKNNITSLISFNNGILKFFDPKTGQEKWQTEVGGVLATEPVIQSNGLFIVVKPLLERASSPSSQAIPYSLRFINKETGITGWTRSIYNEGGLYLYGLKDTLFLINQKSKIIAFDQKTGNILQENSYPGELSSRPFFFGDKVLLPKAGGFVLISLIDGRVILQEKGFSSKLKSLSVNEEMLFFGDERGFLQGLEISSKQRKWKYRLGGAVSSVNYHEGFILAASLDNFVYYFSAERGKLVWKKRAAGRIAAEPLIFNQTALILVEGSVNALLIDLSDGKVINQIIFPEDTYFTGSPQKLDEILIFPTQKGIIAYSFGQCP